VDKASTSSAVGVTRRRSEFAENALRNGYRQSVPDDKIAAGTKATTGCQINQSRIARLTRRPAAFEVIRV
jgi:hypothetical protein